MLVRLDIIKVKFKAEDHTLKLNIK